MGFTEGLIAMYEEPEEVKALMEYLSEYYIYVLKQDYTGAGRTPIYWLTTPRRQKRPSSLLRCIGN
jgi:hypothetical protein